MEQSILDFLKVITWPGAFALLSVLLYKVGFFSGITKKLFNGGIDNSRIDELEKFKKELEKNHLHDLNEAKKDIENLKIDFNKFQIEICERMARVETKLNINPNDKRN